MLNYSGGGRSSRRRGRREEGKEEGPLPSLYLETALNPLSENLGKVLLPFFFFNACGEK